MSEPYSVNKQPSGGLWRRLRKLSDQAGQKLGQVTGFEQTRREVVVPDDQDPIQSLRAHVPQLSRQLLVGRFASVSRLAHQLLPQELMERVTDHLLEQTVQFAELLSGNDALYDESGVLSLHDLRQLDLERADELANLVASRNRLLGATEGAVTGLAGFLGAIADLPLSVIIVLRTIYQTAECYGYDLADLDGRQKIYQLLANTDWSVLVEKQTVLLSLVSVQQLLKQGGVAGLQQRVGSAADLEVFEKLVQELAGSLNIRLPDQLTSRVVPLAGSVVGAFYNTRLINSVAALAQATFRQQRLDHLPKISQSSDTLAMPPAVPAETISKTTPEISAPEISAPEISAPEISAEAVFGHSAADEQVKPQPKKRMVRVKKKSDGEITPNPTDVTPNSDTQH